MPLHPFEILSISVLIAFKLSSVAAFFITIVVLGFLSAYRPVAMLFISLMSLLWGGVIFGIVRDIVLYYQGKTWSAWLAGGLIGLITGFGIFQRRTTSLEGIASNQAPPDPVARVRELEQIRLNHSYKPGWLFFRCQEEGLLHALEYLREIGEIASPSFGGNRNSSSGNESSSEKETRQETPKFDPYEVLGVKQGAPPEEIKTNYKKQMSLYHPDKVSHLGVELQKKAHEKTLEIQKAFEMLLV